MTTAAATARIAEPTLYERDFAAWANEQARLVGERRWGELDVANVVEELESLGRAERSKIGSRLLTILTHLLKIGVGPRDEPVAGWKVTVARSRRELERLLKENPSLASPRVLEEMFTDALADARIVIAQELDAYGELTPDTKARIADAMITLPQARTDGWWPARG